MDEQNQVEDQVIQKSVEILKQGKIDQDPQKKSNVIFLIILGLVIFALVFSAIYFLGLHQ